MSLNYDALRPTNGWHRLASFGHPSKFQRVSRLRFVTAATWLTGGQPNLARCLAVSWAGTLHIHFRWLLPHDGILPGAKFTLRPSLAFSYICVLLYWQRYWLLHGSRAAGVSQNLRHATRNGITELLQTAPPIFGWAAITLGISPLSSFHYCSVRPCLQRWLPVMSVSFITNVTSYRLLAVHNFRHILLLYGRHSRTFCPVAYCS